MRRICLTVVLLLGGIGGMYAQSDRLRESPQMALDFLTLPMDSRSAAIGEAGVGTSPDHYSHYYNPAKYLFGSKRAGASLSYSPWLRNLVNNMNISSLCAYYVVSEFQSVSASFRYFAMGDMEFTDELSQPIGRHSPFQLAIDAAYSRKLSPTVGAAVLFRYALADLYPTDETYKKGWAVAVDLSVYFHKKIEVFGKNSSIDAGFVLNNIGTKVSFYKGGQEYFMPMNVKLGGSLNVDLNEHSQASLNAEFVRSLVPASLDRQDQSAISGMFASIGEGRLNSVTYLVGAEYGFNKMLYGRLGYYHEGKVRGYRKNLCFGAGLVYKIVSLDAAYLVPIGSRQHAMGNTLRLSLSVDI